MILRASLAQILEFPGLVFGGLNVRLGTDARELAQFLESSVWPGSASTKNSRIGTRIVRHDALDVGVDDMVHWSLERLAGLDLSIEEPSPGRFFFYFPVGRLSIP